MTIKKNKKSGVYQILNEGNGKIYIGSSTNLAKRKNEHFRLLRKNKHKNRYLQFSFNKNPDVFKFKVIEYVSLCSLLIREQFYLDKYFDNQESCYNMNPKSESSKGRTPRNTKKVYMFNKKGQKIDEFSSILEASKITDINTASISLCANGKLKSAGGFMWSKFEKAKTPIYKRKRPERTTRKIISPESEIISFTNLSKFCEENNLSYGSIRDVLYGRRKSCFGWRRVNDNNQL